MQAAYISEFEKIEPMFAEQKQNNVCWSEFIAVSRVMLSSKVPQEEVLDT